MTTSPPSLVGKVEEKIQSGNFQRSLAFVAAGSGLLSAIEVSMEHYRGSYGQKIMYTPVVLSGTLAAAGLGGTASPKLAKTLLPIASWALILDGLLGFGFHIRGIARKPGGWSLPRTNIVMGPPIFAPLLLTIGGFLGVISAKLSPEEAGERARIQPSSLRILLAGASAVSGVLNGFEALYSHYKNNFAKKPQWIPIVLTPPIIIAGVAGCFSRKLARSVLAPVSIVGIIAGLVGFYYHVSSTLKRGGVKERPLYNFIYGPPPLAPLLFAATGFLGLLAALVDGGDAQEKGSPK